MVSIFLVYANVMQRLHCIILQDFALQRSCLLDCPELVRGNEKFCPELVLGRWSARTNSGQKFVAPN